MLMPLFDIMNLCVDIGWKIYVDLLILLHSAWLFSATFIYFFLVVVLLRCSIFQMSMLVNKKIEGEIP